ncbi:P-loop containing nucleoside triphosphate hydrolase [Pleurotus pulmonarius]
MLTIKLVVIGASGVGKTSLRGQYISGQFSTSYRATIGADFISKTLPHPRIPGESVTLQIWDTAGQERFASLASAFYRGADAVLLMFDVNRPETLAALRKWWLHFCAHAPLAEEDVGRFCVVVVGNKMDLVGTEQGAPEAVSPAYAWEVIRELMPPISPASPAHEHPDPDYAPDCTPNFNINPDSNANPASTPEDNLYDEMIPHTQLREDPADPEDTADVDGGGDAARSPHVPSESIAIRSLSHSHSHSLSRLPLNSHSRASSRFDTGTLTSVGTVGTVNTIYHTPASSLSTDIFHSARTSPEHSISLSLSSSSSYSSSLPLRVTSPSPNPNSTRSRRNTAFSTSSVSSDGATITPGMLSTPTAPQGDTPTNTSNPHPNTTTTTPSTTTTPTPTHATTSTTNTSTPSPVTFSGPQLFYTSAKTGVGVGGVFGAVVRQVVGRWACEEAREAGAGAGDSTYASGIVNAGGIIERGRNVKTGRRWGTVEVGARWGAQKRKGAGCCAS